MYDRNVAFWATRPLTARMIEWAAGDVTSLFALHAAQVKKVMESDRLKEECNAKSENNAAFLRDKIVHPDRINGRNIGRFIGQGYINTKTLLVVS